jgi:hypothetical protein
MITRAQVEDYLIGYWNKGILKRVDMVTALTSDLQSINIDQSGINKIIEDLLSYSEYYYAL